MIGGLFVVATCGASLWLIISEQERLYNQELSHQLLTEARLIRDALREHWPSHQAGFVAELVGTLRSAGTKVVVVTADGAVLLETPEGADPSSRLSAPDVQQALQVGWSTDTRPWGPDRRSHLIAAARVTRDDKILGVVWLAQPVWALAARPGALARLLGTAGGVAAVATLVFVLIVVYLRRRVFERVIETARSLSSGDLSDVPVVPGGDELAVVASTLNALRTRLASQVETIDRQRRMLQSLVDQLTEGVIVARADGRIALINPTAVRLLRLSVGSDDSAALLGRPVEACIQEHPLQRLLSGRHAGDGGSASQAGETGADDEPTPSEMRLEIQSPGGTTYLLARASELMLAEPGQTAAAAGRVVVLTDITELQRNIQMRADFVANASHELRTPLSTIRAAVEVLLDMDLQKEAPAAMQFLAKIDRHSDRLQQMVTDLLDLSRLELATERFHPEAVPGRRLLRDLHARFAEALNRKQLHWQSSLEPPEAATLHANPHLLRLTLDNLVDNATKFTDPGGHVSVSLCCRKDQAVFTVSDDGRGIPPDEQERVFERFYQLQRSRSGPDRGTGLGLAIVRHAVAAMRGRVSLQSHPGQGTTVTVAIPQGKP